MRLDRSAKKPDPRCETAVVTLDGQVVKDWTIADDKLGVLIKRFPTDDKDVVRTSQVCGEVQILLPS